MVGRRFPEYGYEEGKKLIILGTGHIADVALECFRWDSPYEIAAFSAEKEYIKECAKRGFSVVPFEQLESEYPPDECDVFVAVGYMGLNQVRARLYQEAKVKGYKLASYVSSEAFVWRDAQIGDNAFILEDNTIQPFARIGNNVTLWSGNHIGHGVTVGDHVFVASHIVASGFSSIGDYSFVGVNASIADGIKIGKRCIIGAGAIILSDAEDDGVYVAQRTPRHKFDSNRFIQMKEI